MSLEIYGRKEVGRPNNTSKIEIREADLDLTSRFSEFGRMGETIDRWTCERIHAITTVISREAATNEREVPFSTVVPALLLAEIGESYFIPLRS